MTQLNYRYLLQITLEAKTPLQIGSGEKGIKTDSLVVRDVNGLPFIPGTTLAGLIAHALGNEKEDIMGNQENGSCLIVTEAKLLDKYGNVMDGLIDRSKLDKDNQAFLDNYKRLPIRQHVRIGHKGTTENSGKYDEEVVLKGSRFCFELELMGTEKDKEKIQTLLSKILLPTFRIGSGSRSGFGKVEVVKCCSKDINLSIEEDRNLYLQKSSELGSSWEGWGVVGKDELDKLKGPDSCAGWTHYKLTLEPESFILFGSGFGDPYGNADMDYVRETYVEWIDGKGELVEQEKTLLIPGSSVKGALSHRTAFYYNKLSGAAIRQDGTLKSGKTTDEVVGKHNDAVKTIFGSEGVKVNNRLENKQRGNILISDVIRTTEATPKILNHVSIDRFTGGAIDGALFQEQTLYAKGEEFNIDIMVANEAFEGESGNNIRTAFETALKDIALGMLPLGGGVNRGNGIFIGKVEYFNMEDSQWKNLA